MVSRPDGPLEKEDDVISVTPLYFDDRGGIDTRSLVFGRGFKQPKFKSRTIGERWVR